MYFKWHEENKCDDVIVTQTGWELKGLDRFLKSSQKR